MEDILKKKAGPNKVIIFDIEIINIILLKKIRNEEYCMSDIEL